MKKILTILLIIFIWLIYTEANNAISKIGHVSDQLTSEPIYDKDILVYSNNFENSGSLHINDIKDGCESSFWAMNYIDLTVIFEAYTISPHPTEFNWDFGDGTEGTGQTINHTYSEEGLYFVILYSIDSTGCEFTYEEEIFVFDQGNDCEAFYFYMQYPGINEIQFMDASWGYPTSWAWDFGDGTTSGQQDPIHEFLEAGEYEVCLTIFNEETSCEDTYCEMVFVDTVGDCDSYFWAMNYNGLTVDFEAFTISPYPTIFDWDFGDGTFGTGQFVSHTYQEEGLYLVSLHSIDSTACEFTYEEVIPVFGQGNDCDAFFIYFQNPFMNEIEFLDVSWGDPTSWTWDFGDGTTSSEQNPIHLYAEPGEYEVCLSIYCEETGCEDIYCEILLVGEIPGDCDSYFVILNNNNLTVDFEAYTISVLSTDFYWDFGDGTIGDGQAISHTYPEAGMYLVLLHSIDASGCEFTYEEDIYVGDDCGAYFSYSQNPNMSIIQFLDESWGDPTSWFWQFGDGTTSYEQNPIHEFAEPGEYEVCLNIFCEGTGCEDTYCQNVIVEDYPDCYAQFSFKISSQNPHEVIFTDESYGLFLTWLWDFGDGTSSTEQNPVHVYSDDGEYNVCLRIYSLETQCEDIFCKIIPVIQPCEAGFLFEQDVNNPLKIEFIDYSTGNITEWFWDFGDGTTSYEQNPIHIYPDSGLYNVCLNVSNADMIVYCNDTYCDFVNIVFNTDCSANFIALVDSTSKVPYLYYFYDRTAGNTISWQWDFGDGVISNEQNPIHVYQEPGNYIIDLIIANDSPIGICVDSISKQITTPDYFDLGGSAFIGNHPINNPVFEYDTGIAYLFRSFDDDNIIPIDTIKFYTFGYYWFKEIIEGEYIVKTKLTSNSTHSENFLPSYVTNELLWQNANKIILSDSNVYHGHLYMVSTDYIPGIGAGRIGGYVIQSEKSGKTVYQDIEVLLFNEESMPLTYQYTNQFGEFGFDNLEFGTYKLQAEVTGKHSFSKFITIDEMNPIIDTIKLEFIDNPSGIIDDYIFINKTIVNVFPNPVNDIINIVIDLSKSSDIELRIINCFGQAFVENKYFISPQNNNIKLSVKNLSPGIYLLSAISAENKIFESIKFIKK